MYATRVINCGASDYNLATFDDNFPHVFLTNERIKGLLGLIKFENLVDDRLDVMDADKVVHFLECSQRATRYSVQVD